MSSHFFLDDGFHANISYLGCPEKGNINGNSRNLFVNNSQNKI